MSVRKHNGRNKRTRQLGAIERDVLGDLSSGDALYGFLFSARSTRRMFKLARERANDRYRRKLAIERLVRLGYIHARGERLRITGAGQNALGQVVAKTLELLKTKTWDNKWRIAAFDIPEEYAPLRNKVRTILKRAGFVRLQYSIWIFPPRMRGARATDQERIPTVETYPLRSIGSYRGRRATEKIISSGHMR